MDKSFFTASGARLEHGNRVTFSIGLTSHTVKVMDARVAIELGTAYLCQSEILGNGVPSGKQFGYKYAWQLDDRVRDLSVVAPVCPEEEEA